MCGTRWHSGVLFGHLHPIAKARTSFDIPQTYPQPFVNSETDVSIRRHSTRLYINSGTCRNNASFFYNIINTQAPAALLERGVYFYMQFRGHPCFTSNRAASEGITSTHRKGRLLPSKGIIAARWANGPIRPEQKGVVTLYCSGGRPGAKLTNVLQAVGPPCDSRTPRFPYENRLGV